MNADTQVSFYINVQDKLKFICYLSQKILTTTDNKVLIFTAKDDEFQLMISDALWTLLPNSFLANEINNNDITQAMAPLIISHNKQACLQQNTASVLMDLSYTLITETQFTKILLIVGTTEEDLKISRKLYADYKSHGYQLNHYDVAKFSYT